MKTSGRHRTLVTPQERECKQLLSIREARDLDKAFLHADGLEGLSAMLERRRPEFQQPAFA